MIMQFRQAVGDRELGENLVGALEFFVLLGQPEPVLLDLELIAAELAHHAVEGPGQQAELVVVVGGERDLIVDLTFCDSSRALGERFDRYYRVDTLLCACVASSNPV